MKLLLLASEEQKGEFLSITHSGDMDIECHDTISLESNREGDLLVDLLFEPSPARISWIQQQSFPCVMVNCAAANSGLPAHFIRINGWPGFMKRTLAEACNDNREIRVMAESLLSHTGRTIEWTDGSTGFPGQRIIAAIINEAFLANTEGVAGENDIDTAMKLGTSYPYGPFEWAARIGYKNLVEVLEYYLPENEERIVSILLKEKALAQ